MTLIVSAASFLAGMCSNFFIRCHTDEGFDGFGCAAPDLAITGETEESVERDFRLVMKYCGKSAGCCRT